MLPSSHPARGAWIEICSSGSCRYPRRSRTPHGVRGLKFSLEVAIMSAPPRRTPHGVRGLKFPLWTQRLKSLWSHPARGAWIEIAVLRFSFPVLRSHPARGAWIEIFSTLKVPISIPGRTPHGVRGLKSLLSAPCVVQSWSHPARGAWIEIPAPKLCMM